MARRAEGWKLRYKGEIGYVRFRHAGHRYDLSTGKRDPREASAEAAAIYARVVSGRWRPSGVADGARPFAPLVDLLSEWIAAGRGSYAEGTLGIFEVYARRWIDHFADSLSRITTASIGDYSRARLREVSRATVQKERAALRTFLDWCAERGVVAEVPDFPKLRKGATGVRAVTRKAEAVDLTNDEVERWIAAMPVWSSEAGGGRGKRFHVQAFFRVLWETGLRPSTVARISVPEHYRKGARELVLTDAIDKVRFGRTLPLTLAARAALDLAAPEAGPIFGKHDYREFTRVAAKKAGLDAEKVAAVSPYDLRHARVTNLLDATSDLLGVGYLVGHTQTTTTDIYARSRRKMGARVLAAVGDGIGGNTGPETKTPPSTVAEDGADLITDSAGVRRRGLEPLRLLGASTSTQRVRSEAADFSEDPAASGRGEAPGSPLLGPLAPKAIADAARALDGQVAAWDVLDLWELAQLADELTGGAR